MPRYSGNHIPLPGADRRPPRDARKIGESDPDQTVTLTLELRRARPDKHAQHVHDHLHGHHERPRDPLDPLEFLDQGFGTSEDDLRNVVGFLEGHGLEVIQTHPHARVVRVSGSLRSLLRLFKADVADYEAPDGKRFRGREGELHVPEELAGVVEGVFGFDRRPVANPHFKKREATEGTFAPHAVSGGYTPLQVAQAYSFPPNLDGTGQTIAVIELGGGYYLGPLNGYFGSLGIPHPPSIKALGIDGGRNAPDGPDGADGEVQLDIEVAGAVAPGASQNVYFATNTDQGFLDAILSAVHDPRVSIITISWGSPESEWTAQAKRSFNNAFQDAGILGKTVLAAAGDAGSGDGEPDGRPHVDFPASSPYVVACGGTSLQASGGTVTTETVWNGQGATGGGVSTFFPLPSWQAGSNVPRNPAGTPGRGVPDLAGNADPATGYQVSIDGHATVIGGTSAVAPLYAGLFALINQARKAAHKPNVGFPHPVMYANAAAFRDITQGSNGAYSAGPGWDACTGLGVPIGTTLLTAFLA